MSTKIQNSEFIIHNSNIVGIDTRDPQNTSIFVFNGKKWSIKKISLKQQTAGSHLLAVLEKLLVSSSRRKSGSRQKQEILKLVVINGYGERFSSLRLGVIIANALSLAKEIPLYGATLPAKEFDLNKIKIALLKALKTKPKVQKPLYAAEPNITIRAS